MIRSDFNTADMSAIGGHLKHLHSFNAESSAQSLPKDTSPPPPPLAWRQVFESCAQHLLLSKKERGVLKGARVGGLADDLEDLHFTSLEKSRLLRCMKKLRPLLS